MTIREKAVQIAVKEIGVREDPLGSNTGPRVKQYQAATNLKGTGWPWCMAFVCWCFKQAKHPLPYPTASVGNFRDWAAKHGDLVDRPERPFRGDLVCFEWAQDDWPDHIGFVEKVLALRWLGGQFVGWIRTVEGNSNDRVQRNLHWVKPRYQFVRIPGDA